MHNAMVPATPTQELADLLLITQVENQPPLQSRHPTLQHTLEDLVQLFEDYLRRHNPNAVIVAYNLGQLCAFLEKFHYLAIIIKISNSNYQTYHREWIFNQLRIYLRPRISVFDGRITAWCGNDRSVIAPAPQQPELAPCTRRLLENQPSTSDCSIARWPPSVHQQPTTSQQVNVSQPGPSAAPVGETSTAKQNRAKRQQVKSRQKKPQLQQQNQAGPIEKINHIKTQACILKAQINAGVSADEQYHHLYDMLNKQLHLLETIDYDGKEVIEKAWAEAAECIRDCLTTLKSHSRASQKF